MCPLVFSSPRRGGGFDSQDFLSFIHAANDITEIVLPRPGTPGKLAGSQGQVEREKSGNGGRERERGRN